MSDQKTFLTSLSNPRRIALSLLACALTAGAAFPLSALLDLANMVMLFLLTVLIVAVTLGKSAAVIAAITSVLLFDIFFVPPRFSPAVDDLQYLITFGVMLAVALITGHLAATLKEQASEARIREQRIQALYEVARKLAGVLGDVQVNEILHEFITQTLKGEHWLMLRDRPLTPPPWLDPALVRQALETGESQFAAEGAPTLCLCLNAQMGRRGVLAVHFAETEEKRLAETRELLEALASLVAIALERLHYVEVARNSEIKMATEQLRSSILSALSHDLRTPLTVLVGLADTLALGHASRPEQTQELAAALRDQAHRLSTLVTNLLEMAKLNAGEIRLHREWQPLQEVIGSSLKILGSALEQHRIRIDLPADLPLLHFDAVMIERVLCNLLENAAKYAPPGSLIEIGARTAHGTAILSVSDQGPGFDNEERQAIFGMFVRGRLASDIPGTGLGLAIAHAIVQAHQGSMWIEQTGAPGACVQFSLPLGQPPQLEPEAP